LGVPVGLVVVSGGAVVSDAVVADVAADVSVPAVVVVADVAVVVVCERLSEAVVVVVAAVDDETGSVSDGRPMGVQEHINSMIASRQGKRFI
jgi:hypothetical protein